MLNDATGAREYVNRIQAEITEEAHQRRESNPTLAIQEREINQAWTRSAPSAAAVRGDGASPAEVKAHSEHLLGCIDDLSLLSVDAPVGKRKGVRQLKGTVRALTRWYLRYLADQVNAFNHFLVGFLRSAEQRIARLEGDAHAAEIMGEFVDPVLDADHVLGQAVADQLSQCDGPVAVVSCGSGRIVSALVQAGITAHGVDDSVDAINDGVNEGLDLRVAAPSEHLSRIADGSLSGVVLTRFVERRGPVELSTLIDEALRCVTPSGRIVVAVADLSARSGPEAELLRGTGLSPQTWAHLLRKRGCVVEVSALTGSRVTTLVTAQPQ
ncbi:MAG: class I SAM-dependent methyltransferase [Acidimicrobiaceae bacterium]|nr:methyltransferase domain-containing protein [Acidimicrobiaceae bacterium]MXW62638.1 class I SAM-dependent methyltransferase [Acidimicrobiaceae bacterium]MXW74768.1 class I SAM-dependent methyltransferase [Acidimicrobiaceae bacterium]MYA73447.1 class I SAM-dependent methyltransferase [Acidimicrobiaceae bacterium]MYC42039.1 class I SAM-dependent methyltransferase [Acidimicrobiaceae bacterium]